jgi:sugar transferase EpsL
MKRLLDLSVAIVTLVLALPILGIVAVLIRFTMGSPVLFRQKRPGRHGQIFELIKFRTMAELNGPDGEPLSDEERLTALGRFLRRSSIDELPQLWNVIRGDMSLVGPRPLLAEYLELYSQRQSRRHEVLPGITGLAQVLGRNAIEWEDRLELDVQYVERQSLQMDLRILWMTVACVLRRSGISHEGHATMPRFLGSMK